MEKRLLLAIALSFLVLGAYSAVLPKPKQPGNKEVTNKTYEKYDAVVPAAPPSQATNPVVSPKENLYNNSNGKELYSIESDGLILKFSKTGGYLKEAFDKKQNTVLSTKNIGFVAQWSDYVFSLSEITRGVVFSFSSLEGTEIKKTYRIKSDNTLELTIEIINATDSKLTGYDIFGGSFNPKLEKDQASSRYYESCAVVNGILVRKTAFGQKRPIDYDGHVLWAGLRDRYFCSVFVPQINVNKGVVDNIGDDIVTLFNIPERKSGPNNARVEDNYRIYLGIQDEKALKEFGDGAERMINYGTFDGISKALLFFLKLAYKVSHSWGLAIILITVFVYCLLFPLSFKSMLSMKKMQAIQPKIDELRAKLKANPQKLNTEIMELYKKEKVNPFGGCLPMILQIPVFFSLYQLLMRFISLRGTNFLWIKDLSEPDRLFVFKMNYPVIGNDLNILPLLMAIGMFFQQKMSMSQTAASPEAAQQQKIMLFMMPALFGVMFYKLPAGLVLYWFVNSLLTIAFQWKISRIKV